MGSDTHGCFIPSEAWTDLVVCRLPVKSRGTIQVEGILPEEELNTEQF